jgi:hypothetical protein
MIKDTKKRKTPNMSSNSKHICEGKEFKNEADARAYAIENSSEHGTFVTHAKSRNCVACYYAGSTR